MHVARTMGAVLLIAMLSFPPLISAVNEPRKPVEEERLPIFPKDYEAYAKGKQYTSLSQFYQEIGFWNQTSDKLRALIMYNARELIHAPDGVEILKVYKTMPLASVSVDRKKFTELSNLMGIKKVYLDHKVETTAYNFFKDGKLNLKADAYYPFIGKFPTLLNETTRLIGAQDLWKRGIMGNNTIIAILDSGFDATHPNLDHLGKDPKALKAIKQISMIDIPEERNDVRDLIGHGSHVAGIASSNGAAPSPSIIVTTVGGQVINATILPNTQMGVAPMSKLYNVKVLSNEGFGLISWIISGIEWASENGADVITMSLGAYPFFVDDDPMALAVEKAVKKNVTVVTSAGNAGPATFAIGTPGKSRDAIAVGATYGTRYPIYFSSRGPSSYNLIQKPDLIAPGMVVSNWAFYKEFERTFYLELAGTSMAAPHVAGAVSLLKQAFPAASPYAIKAALLKGATDLGYEPSMQGAGFLNVSKAYDILSQAQGDFRRLEADEVDLSPVRPISNFTGSLAGTRILFIGDPDKHETYLNKLFEEGARIRLLVSGALTASSLRGIDVLVLAEPFSLTHRLYNRTVINTFVRAGGSLFFIGDELRTEYDAFTRQYGITWSSLAMGGYSTKINNHATTRNVKNLWFGGSITSLNVNPNVAQVVALDPLYPAAAAWADPFGRAKVFVLADDDVLNNDNIAAADNMAFGLNIISYLASVKIAARPPFREVAVGLRHPRFVIDGNPVSFKLLVTNFGTTTERVLVSVNITNDLGRVVQSWNLQINQLDAGRTYEERLESNPLKANAPFANFNIIALARTGVPEINIRNNRINATLEVISKITSAGNNPRLVVFAPSKITSSTPPTMTYFPGDFKVLNVTLLTSYTIKNAKVRITGDAAKLTSFSNAKTLVQTAEFFGFPDSTPQFFNYGKKFDAGKEVSIGELVGYKGLPIQIVVPKNATAGSYKGAIELVEGDRVTASVQIDLTISKPKETILFDDVFHGIEFFGLIVPVDVERLWGGSFRGTAPSPWYSTLARNGFQMVSLRQYMNETGTLDPWKVFMSGQFKNIVLHDTEFHAGRTGVFPLLLNNGTNLEIHYDNDFRGATLGQVSADRQAFFGLVKNFNNSSPIGRGIANATFVFGVELAARPGAQVIATASNPVNPELSGVVAASFKVGGGGKLVAIGDSSLFEFSDDYLWLINHFLFGINGTTVGEMKLGANAISYLTNKAPTITNLATDKQAYGAGSQVELRYGASASKSARVNLKDTQGRIIATFDQIPAADNRLTIPLSDKIPLGTYSIDVRVIDEMGDFVEKTVAFSVKNLIPPALQVINPKPDQKILGIIKVEVLGEAKSPGAMELFIDNNRAAIWSEVGARSYVWDTTQVPAGQHRIRLIAVDQDGNTNEATINVEVTKPPKAPPPTLQIVSPIPNQKLIGITKIEVLGEAKAAGKMDLFIDNEKVQSWSDIGARSYLWNASLASEGVHKIRVTASDEDGNTAEATADVFAARPPVPPPPPPPPLLTNTEILMIAMNAVTIAVIAVVVILRSRNK